MLSSVLQKIPLLIAGLMLFIAVVTIYFRSKNVTKSEFFKILKSVKLLTVWVLIFTFVLTCAFAVFNHMRSKQYVRAVIALNYSEASQAQNSNGTRFNMTEMICDEVIERAIKKGAFEDVTVKDLKSCLYVFPNVQGDVDHESNYHISTEFIIEYYASKHTDHLDAENVIALIASSYKDYYIEKYTDNYSATSEEDKPDYSEMEYMDIVAYLNKETTSVLNFLYGMAEKAPSFVTSSNTTFNSIAGKVYQFRETQIEQNLKALILQYGIARDRQGYIDRLTYHTNNISITKDKNTASFNLCNAAIDMYAEEMTRVVLVPTWDESGKYYMGRTKVGLDELSVMATGYSNQIAENVKEIVNNEIIINRMGTENVTYTGSEQADSLIASIDEVLNGFTVEAIAAGREYSNYRMNQCIAVSISGSSLFGELKSIAVFAVLAYAAAIALEASKKLPKAK